MFGNEENGRNIECKKENKVWAYHSETIINKLFN